MLRKLVTIFVLVLFVISTTGFTISKHYCHGNLVSVKINSEAKSCCDISGSACCHNETEIFQLQEDFTFMQSSIADVDFVLDISLFIQESYELVNNTEIGSIYLEKGFIPPPDLSVILADIQSFRL